MDGSSQIISFTVNANDQVVSYEQTYAGSVQVLGKSVNWLQLKGRLRFFWFSRTNFVEGNRSIGKIIVLSIAWY